VKEISMPDTTPQPRVNRIYRYSIASSDMYYTELEQRDVFVSDDPVNGFQIWGQIASGGRATSVCLCQMLLEYAMYCHSWSSLSEAIFNMRLFGEQLGVGLARFIKETPPAEIGQNAGACSLMCLWEAMNIQFTVEQVGPEMRFFFANCPLEEIAQRNGLREVDLALYGVNALCQTLIHIIDPRMEIMTPVEARQPFVFTVKETVS
jgi:hypothetical protein